MQTQTPDKNELLGTYRIFPLIFRMAIPTVLAQLVNLLYGIIDRIYIGHIPDIGKDALAGIGVAGTVVMLVAAFANIIAGGAAPLAAIALGKGERDRAERILGNGVFLILVFTVLCMGLSYAFMTPILTFAGASEVTLVYAREYLSVYLIGTLFVMLAYGLNTFISIQGRPVIAMTSVIIGALLNTALDPLFIFAFDMGVKGAAIATVISQTISAAFVLAFLVSRHATLKIKPKNIIPDRSIILKTIALGISPFVMASTESLVGFVLNGQLSSFGDIYVSSLTVMQSAMQIISIPLAGFTQGVSPIISYNYGHKSNARVKETLKYTMIIGVGFNLLGMLGMIAFPRTVASMFTNDAALIEIVGKYMPIFLTGMTIFGLQRVCQNTFVALGDAKVSLFIALLRKVILLIPLALLLPRFMDVIGVYTAEAIADASAAIICTVIFAFRFPELLRKNQANE
ncbi:MAG: MATE family efflux transporter [Ruminococcaceae bacterium]|nr:MATE family efflux transporter [Oscillospiraceae bacterium]